MSTLTLCEKKFPVFFSSTKTVYLIQPNQFKLLIIENHEEETFSIVKSPEYNKPIFEGEGDFAEALTHVHKILGLKEDQIKFDYN